MTEQAEQGAAGEVGEGEGREERSEERKPRKQRGLAVEVKVMASGDGSTFAFARPRRRQADGRRLTLRERRLLFGGLDAADRLEDPTAGIVSYFLWLYSGNAAGERFGERHEGQILVHRNGWSTAHGGTVGEVQVDPYDQLLRAAGLTEEEIAVGRLQARDPRPTYGAIGAELGFSYDAVTRLVGSGQDKLYTYGLAMGRLARCTACGEEEPETPGGRCGACEEQERQRVAAQRMPACKGFRKVGGGLARCEDPGLFGGYCGEHKRRVRR